MTRKICFVTSSRADYGLIRNLLKLVREHPQLELQIVATGSHLSDFHGLTKTEIELDGFSIDFEVKLAELTEDAPGISAMMSQTLTGCAQAFEKLSPDLIVVLGDRYEIFAATSAALVAKIPVAHLHGGELTEGAYDDTMRHCITKLSHLHFVANDEFRKRVIQLGENPERVFTVGGLGVDNLYLTTLLSRERLERDLDLKFGSSNLLITFHPVTLGECSSKDQFKELLNSLKEFPETTLIFTMPNADVGNFEIKKQIKEFVEARENAHVFTFLGYQKYLSLMKIVDAVIGNSSSGLMEAPSVGVPTINIGSRQKGRPIATSVINCTSKTDEISKAIRKLYSPEFQVQLTDIENPYGLPGSSQKIVSVLAEISLDGLIRKVFYDL